MQLIDPIKKETSKLFNEEVSPIQRMFVFSESFLLKFCLSCMIYSNHLALSFGRSYKFGSVFC